MQTSWTLKVAAALVIFATLPGSGHSQERNAGLQRFVVDFVTLRSGERLRGAVLNIDSSGLVVMAIQRDWLKKNQPRMFAQQTASEHDRNLMHARQQVQRIERWLDERQDPPTLAAFLEIELERAQRLVKSLELPQPDNEPSQFLVIQFPKDRVQSLLVQPPANRALAIQAWSERLLDVEHRERTELRKELTAKGVGENDQPDLSDRLPPLGQTDTEWAARRAIVEFHFGRKLEFQGIGEALFRTGEGADKLDLGQLLAPLFEEQIRSQLGDLIGEPKSAFGPGGKQPKLARATDTAEAENCLGLRVTQLQIDASHNKVIVTTRFMARMPGGTWESVWEQAVTEDAAKPRPEFEDRIRSDPQIKPALEAFAVLGGSAEQTVKFAIRIGAVTMAAQQAADRRFFEFRDRYLQRLDGPPLRWSASAPGDAVN